MGASTAAAVAAGVGAAASAAGGIMSATASGDAAGAQSDAAGNANRTQWKMYTTTRGDNAPAMFYGTGALEEIAKLMGLYKGGTPENIWPTSMANEARDIRTKKEWDFRDALKDLRPQRNLLTGGPVDASQAPEPLYGPNGEVLDPDSPEGRRAAAARDALKRQDLQRSRQAIQREALGMRGMTDAELWATYGRKTPVVDPREAQREAMERFTASPDYQFRLSEGNKQILRNAAATGGAQSGATQKALLNYGQGLASGEYNNYLNRLFGIAGAGQTAINNVAAIGSNTANQMSQNHLAAGQARASGYINQANAITGMLDGIGSNLGYMSGALVKRI